MKLLSNIRFSKKDPLKYNLFCSWRRLSCIVFCFCEEVPKFYNYTNSLLLMTTWLCIDFHFQQLNCPNVSKTFNSCFCVDDFAATTVLFCRFFSWIPKCLVFRPAFLAYIKNGGRIPAFSFVKSQGSLWSPLWWTGKRSKA